MKIILILLSMCFLSTLFAQKPGKIPGCMKITSFPGDTNYSYGFPFKENRKILVAQGYNGLFSHRGEYALDFKVKQGTPIYAVRGGIVDDLKQDSDRGGCSKKFLYDGNYILILHDDGTYAGYWHLKKDGVAVAKGDTVSKGQLIGYSGNTGFSTAPHLHFWVYGFDKEWNFHTIPTQFETHKGLTYLRGWRWYKGKSTE